MANHEHKIDHLDQPIPPAEPSAAAAGHPARRRLGVADPYALCCRLFRVLTLVLIAAGIIALVLWLVFQPKTLKAYVDSATLTRFDLAAAAGNVTGTQLLYNLTAAVSIRNPNRRQAVVYGRLEAVALYGGEQFGYERFPQMLQEGKSTMGIQPSFGGQEAVAGATAATFGREKPEGFFNINLKLHTRARLRVSVVKSAEYRLEVDCYIRVPDPANATAVKQGFTATQCHVDDFN